MNTYQSASVLVDRSTPFGNPFKLGHVCSRCNELHTERGSTIDCFRAYAIERLAKEPHWLDPLVGKTLYCSGCRRTSQTCHARVLEELRPRPGRRLW